MVCHPDADTGRMPPGHLDDPARLTELRSLGILDTPAEPAYDDIARLASASCRSAIAAVNFVDDTRHWTKAVVGIEGGQGASVSADVSFCAATVATAGGLLNVSDTSESEDWRAHPLVTGHPHLRFYAGATIVVSGQPVGVVCVFGDEPRDLGEQEEQALVALARQASALLELRTRNADLIQLAVSDPLTGLANRTLLLDHLQMAIAQHERSGGRVGVAFCDVDGFKRVNDRSGHEAGDRLLGKIADRLRAATRSGIDTVARFGGDEFVVVCPGLTSPQEFDAVLDRIDRAVHVHDPADGPAVARLTIGAALLRDGESAASVLRRADEAMYDGKRTLSAPVPAQRGGLRTIPRR